MAELQPLIVVVADRSMKATIDAILDRLLVGIKPDSRVMTNYDASVVRDSAAYLRSFIKSYKYALVMCDRIGCGRNDTREVVEHDIEARLAANGWSGRSAAIVIDPELEVWIWQYSPHVAKALGWRDGRGALYKWLRDKCYLGTGKIKPQNPKTALNDALWLKQVRKSSSVFEEVARAVALDNCADPAFGKLRAVLEKWFPDTKRRGAL
ncbi:MAG TPA: hypothetical protein VM120_11270 [Bryobacteraceae bacterium]|nr:hypothetical protein [Bryobacteraceae bacterium]